jgi:hypothetical protein
MLAARVLSRGLLAGQESICCQGASALVAGEKVKYLIAMKNGQGIAIEVSVPDRSITPQTAGKQTGSVIR